MRKFLSLLSLSLLVSAAFSCKSKTSESSTSSTTAAGTTSVSATAAPAVPGSWEEKASKYEGPAGTRFTVNCSGTPQFATVWGTDLYTDDSSICTAAVHAGVVDAKGGSVTFEIRPGESEYVGTTRHEIATLDYASWARSFVFVGKDGKAIEPVRSAIRLATWSLTPSLHRSATERRYTYNCPPGGAPATVWGSDVYSDDTPICTAAVHAGRINLTDGGIVTIELRPGQEKYEASERNGVQSSAYGSWGGSFVFIDTPKELLEEAAKGKATATTATTTTTAATETSPTTHQ